MMTHYITAIYIPLEDFTFNKVLKDVKNEMKSWKKWIGDQCITKENNFIQPPGVFSLKMVIQGFWSKLMQ